MSLDNGLQYPSNIAYGCSSFISPVLGHNPGMYRYPGYCPADFVQRIPPPPNSRSAFSVAKNDMKIEYLGARPPIVPGWHERHSNENDVEEKAQYLIETFRNIASSVTRPIFDYGELYDWFDTFDILAEGAYHLFLVINHIAVINELQRLEIMGAARLWSAENRARVMAVPRTEGVYGFLSARDQEWFGFSDIPSQMHHYMLGCALNEVRDGFHAELDLFRRLSLQNSPVCHSTVPERLNPYHHFQLRDRMTPQIMQATNTNTNSLHRTRYSAQDARIGGNQFSIEVNLPNGHDTKSWVDGSTYRHSRVHHNLINTHETKTSNIWVAGYENRNYQVQRNMPATQDSYPKKLWVGGFETQDYASLHPMFSEHGKITAASELRGIDRDRPYAFIEFSTQESATNAVLKLNNHYLQSGSQLVVKHARKFVPYVRHNDEVRQFQTRGIQTKSFSTSKEGPRKKRLNSGSSNSSTLVGSESGTSYRIVAPSSRNHITIRTDSTSSDLREPSAEMPAKTEKQVISRTNSGLPGLLEVITELPSKSQQQRVIRASSAASCLRDTIVELSEKSILHVAATKLELKDKFEQGMKKVMEYEVTVSNGIWKSEVGTAQDETEMSNGLLEPQKKKKNVNNKPKFKRPQAGAAVQASSEIALRKQKSITSLGYLGDLIQKHQTHTSLGIMEDSTPKSEMGFEHKTTLTAPPTPLTGSPKSLKSSKGFSKGFNPTVAIPLNFEKKVQNSKSPLKKKFTHISTPDLDGRILANGSHGKVNESPVRSPLRRSNSFTTSSSAQETISSETSVQIVMDSGHEKSDNTSLTDVPVSLDDLTKTEFQGPTSAAFDKSRQKPLNLNHKKSHSSNSEVNPLVYTGSPQKQLQDHDKDTCGYLSQKSTTPKYKTASSIETSPVRDGYSTPKENRVVALDFGLQKPITSCDKKPDSVLDISMRNSNPSENGHPNSGKNMYYGYPEDSSTQYYKNHNYPATSSVRDAKLIDNKGFQKERNTSGDSLSSKSSAFKKDENLSKSVNQKENQRPYTIITSDRSQWPALPKSVETKDIIQQKIAQPIIPLLSERQNRSIRRDSIGSIFSAPLIACSSSQQQDRCELDYTEVADPSFPRVMRWVQHESGW